MDSISLSFYPIMLRPSDSYILHHVAYHAGRKAWLFGPLKLEKMVAMNIFEPEKGDLAVSTLFVFKKDDL